MGSQKFSSWCRGSVSSKFFDGFKNKVFATLDAYLPERDHVTSLFFAVMVPGDRIYFQHLWHFHETAEVHALAERHGQSLVDNWAFAHAPRRVSHVLQ